MLAIAGVDRLAGYANLNVSEGLSITIHDNESETEEMLLLT